MEIATQPTLLYVPPTNVRPVRFRLPRLPYPSKAEWCARYGPVEAIPEHQDPGTCRVCGKPCRERSRHYCAKGIQNGRWHSSCDDVWTGRYYGGRFWLCKHVFARDDYHCQDCGLAALKSFVADGPAQPDPGPLEMHHVRALCDGGTHDPDNLTTLCVYCHAARHGRVPVG